ncbi:glycosyltransferase family A protein [Paenibacillus polymyxa]|uniref:glycosyltransferase family A protein n=1 Tax=Paenibacillus polymyxa TaxID=1406 RepID=UPI0032AF6182
MKKKKVLVGSPIRQNPSILKEFLESLRELEQETIELSYLFIDDNDNPLSSKILLEFSESTANVMIHKNSSTDYYFRNEITHSWDEQLIWKVAQLKDIIIQIALEYNYDYLFFVDSDIVLHPRTIEQLKNTEKEIVSEIFWTKWYPDSPELPQVWLTDQYNMSYKNRSEQLSQEEIAKRESEFIRKLRVPGVYEVGGLGACTLISKSAIEKGVNFKEIKNVSFWGEDRHFCIRASALGISLFVDTHFPAFHIYREEDLQKVEQFKTRAFNEGVFFTVKNGIELLGSFHYKKGYHPDWKKSFTKEYGDLLSKKMEDELNENIKKKVIVKANVSNFWIDSNRSSEIGILNVKFDLINDGISTGEPFHDKFRGEATLLLQNNKWLIDSLEIV